MNYLFYISYDNLYSSHANTSSNPNNAMQNKTSILSIYNI